MIQIDMEMPMDCEECPLNDEYAECALLGKIVAKCGRLPDCPLRETIRCNQCRFYEGVHGVHGCAPCTFWGIGAVMWDDYCSRGEVRRMNEEVKTYVEGKREPHILIKMPMPRDCVECPLTYPIHDGGAEYCCLTDVPEYIYRYGERPAECPLREVKG